jgi:hypothetical protein
MAKVPTARSQRIGTQVTQAPQTPFQSVSTSPDMFGATQARQIAGLGSALGAFAQPFLQAEAEERARIEKQAYHRSLAQYKSQFLTKYGERLASGHENLAVDAQALSEQLKQEVVGAAPASIAEALAARIDEFHLSRVPYINQDERKGYVQQGRTDLSEALLEFKGAYDSATDNDARDSMAADIKSALEDAEEAGLIESAELEFDKQMSSLDEARARRLLTDDPAALVDAIEAGEFKHVRETTLASLRDRGIKYRDAEIARQEKQRQAEIAAQAADERERISAEIEVGVSRGQIGQDQLDDYRKRGVITDSQWARLTKQSDKIQKEMSSRAARAELVRSSSAGSGRLYPNIPDHRKAVDEEFLRIQERDQNKPVEEQLTNVVNLIDRTGIMPSSLKSDLSVIATLDNADSVQMAYDLFSRLQAKSPGIVSTQLDQKTVAFYGVYGDKVKYLDKKSALDATRNQLYETSPAKKQERRELIADATKKAPALLEELVEQDYDGFFKYWLETAPQNRIPDAMLIDFKTLFEVFIESTNGDVKKASRLAYNSLKNQWGETKINGKSELVRDPVEVLHPAGPEDKDWMREQALEDLTPLTGGREFRIEQDTQTRRTKENSYAVFVINENGLKEILMGEDNQPVRWYPDWQRSPEFKRRQQEDEAAVDRARRVRAMEKEIEQRPPFITVPPSLN